MPTSVLRLLAPGSLAFALVLATGCSCSCAPPPPACECRPVGPSCPGVICPAFPDAGDAGTDAPDARVHTDPLPPIPCGVVGAAGGRCRGGSGGTCGAGVDCQSEILDTATRMPLTVRAAFGIAQGAARDPETGFYEAVPDAETEPASDVPVPIASGSLCTQECDAAAATDACGRCTTCVTDVGTTGVFATYLLYPEAMRPFGDATGWCRADCAFDAAARGDECPAATAPTAHDAHTCSPASRVCVEGCVSDAECRFSFEATREGLFVTVLDETSTASCSPATRRCAWTRADATSVGDPCVRASDCAEDVGVCLNGGTCAEYDCAFAADTTGDMLCDGGAGICLGNGGNQASICVAGCTSPEDCNRGSTCIPLGPGVTVGGFTGYCLGICDTVLNDPDGAAGPRGPSDDILWPCRAEERCDVPAPTADDLDPVGRCRAPCLADADCTDRSPDEGDLCELVPGADPPHGFCRWRDQVCGPLELSADCVGGQVCDLLAWPEDLGLCVEPCASDADCAGGETCVTAGGRGVCRRPCTTDGAACPVGQTCLGAPGAEYCEQPPPVG